MNKREIGKIGEEIAKDYLEKNGIKIIDKNYFSKYGEIDLIGFENRTIIFIEVKLRNNIEFGSVCESVTESKIMKIYDASKDFLSNTELDYDDCRFDVILINSDKDCSNCRIEWLKNQYFN